MRELILYTRPGCHLCADARATIEAILAERGASGLEPATLIERDISTNPAWEQAWFAEIPVVELGERRLTMAISPLRLRRFLDDALGTVVTA